MKRNEKNVSGIDAAALSESNSFPDIRRSRRRRPPLAAPPRPRPLPERENEKKKDIPIGNLFMLRIKGLPI